MSNNILGKKILIITAHPDDETYLAAGTIHENRKAGGLNFLLCATFGEKGSAHLKERISEKKLAAVRKRELERACKFLGIDQAFTPGIPDGMVEQESSALKLEADKILKSLEPDAIISFGEDGITGHNDHLAVGRIARALAEENGLPLYFFTLSPKLCENGCSWLNKKRLTGVYQVGYKEHSQATFGIPIDSQTKAQALQIYVSQLDNGNPFNHYPPEAVTEFLTAEYFHRFEF